MGLVRTAAVLGCLLSAQVAHAAGPGPRDLPGDTTVRVPAPVTSGTDLTAQERSTRAQTLARYLRPDPILTAVEPYWGGVSGTACLAGAVGAQLDGIEDSRGSKPYLIGILGTCAAVSFASYALPHDYQNRVVAAAFFGGAGLAVIPFVHFNDYATPANRVTAFAFGGSYIAFAGMSLIDAALSRPVSFRTLERDVERLDAWGGSLDDRELGRMERHLRREQDSPIPRWSWGAMQLVAGMVAVSPAFVTSTSRDDRKLAYLGGGLLATQGAMSLAFAAAAPKRYDAYVSALSNVQLAPVGPDGSLGASLSGTF